MKWGKVLLISAATAALALWLKENVKISVTCEVTKKEPDGEATTPVVTDEESSPVEA